MKLQTHILPRRDGSVIVRSAMGKAYVFKADAGGALVCEVDDAVLVAQLLCRGDDFEPADAADFEKARELISTVGGDGQDGDRDDDDDEQEVGGLPIEANTPPRASARPRKAR